MTYNQKMGQSIHKHPVLAQQYWNGRQIFFLSVSLDVDLSEDIYKYKMLYIYIYVPAMASQKQIDEAIEKICDDFIVIYQDMEFDRHNLKDCLIRLMECVELMPTLIGADKKKVVLGVIVVLIEKLKINEGEKEVIIYLLEHDIIALLVEIIVKLTKNPAQLNAFRTGAKASAYCELL